MDAGSREALLHRPTAALADLHKTIGQNDGDKMAPAIVFLGYAVTTIRQHAGPSIHGASPAARSSSISDAG